MKQFNCVIIDDDEIDRITVASYAKRFPIFNVAGIFPSAAAALPVLEKAPIDVLFLDIDMPGLSGIEFRKKMAHVPVCIFITAHPEHAAETFEVETLDFIIKPVKIDRFTHTVQRIEDYMEMKTKASLFESSIGGDTIYIKEGYEQTKVKLHDILYLEALKDYTKIVTSQKKHCVLTSIGNLLKESHFQSFIRIHRSFAVQKHFVKKIKSNEIELDHECKIPIGRNYRHNLQGISV